MEGKDVKRRLVQSTLFPPKASFAKEGENCDAGEEVAEEEELSRRRRRTGNSKSKKTTRASKKATDSCKEASNKQVTDSDSPVLERSNCFINALERPQQKGVEKQLVISDSPEENGEICSPPCPPSNVRSTPGKLKRRKNTTPRKERRNSTPNKKMKNGKREVCCRIPFDLSVGEQPLQTIPNLRLEAKLTAEENSRMFAGRQIHPFFASCKGGKRNQDLIDSEDKGFPYKRKEGCMVFNPIHVFEHVEDDNMTLDWGHWIFAERSAAGDMDYGCSPVYEGSVDSLNFDNFFIGSCCKRESMYKSRCQRSSPVKDVSNEFSHNPEYLHPIASTVLSNKRVDYKPENDDLFAGISCGGSSDSELHEKLLQERIISHYHACHNQPENCLWTNKYQPQNAKQICGNGESVKLLSEWLQLWHKRGTLTSRSCTDEVNLAMQDNDHDYEQYDSNYDATDDEERLMNVLLITGPVGSGKSAAVYACARDQGFHIIEINASDWRNGALVRQKFGEAVESHWLQRTTENGPISESNSPSKFFKAVSKETHCSDNDVVKLIHLSDKEDSEEAGLFPSLSVSGENGTPNSQNEIKTLILFEDVDATLCEDHGFMTTIQQLAETAKRPMILTSNSDNPALPKNLERLEVKFSVPSRDELLELANMICVSEKAKIHSSLVERFVDHCQRDIRKTIMLLQFWCQGQTLGKGNEFRTTYCPTLFDLDAGHRILPKVTNFDYPSMITDLVATEIMKSLILVEENNDPIKVYMQEIDPGLIEAKKKVMLSLQSSVVDEVDSAQFEAPATHFDFSCSPLELEQKKDRRRTNTVLYSNSEDAFTGGNIPSVSAGVNIDIGIIDMKNIPTLHDHQTPFTYQSDLDRLEDCRLFMENVDCSLIEDSCKSLDMSVVPESSFVPETALVNGEELYSTTVSYGHFDNTGVNYAILDQNSIPILEHASSSKYLGIVDNSQDTIGIDFGTRAGASCQEEVGDSLSKPEADFPWGNHLLDECSRVDFARVMKSLDEDPESEHGIDFVTQAWDRLYGQSQDLRKYVTTEEKTVCQTLKLVHGMSNLIAESDLMLKDCQTIVSDSVESKMVPSDKIQSACYYDDQVEISSIIAQHGMCLYAKKIASLESILGSTNTLDLASQMLSSSASSIALGKLASRNHIEVAKSDSTLNKDFNLLTSDSRSCVRNIVKTVVPPRLYLTAKGNSFHEYFSTLSQISRFGSSRLSETADSRRQRRRRVPRHYLSSGSLSMSSEEISLLGRYNSFQKDPSFVR